MKVFASHKLEGPVKISSHQVSRFVNSSGRLATLGHAMLLISEALVLAKSLKYPRANVCRSTSEVTHMAESDARSLMDNSKAMYIGQEDFSEQAVLMRLGLSQ